MKFSRSLTLKTGPAPMKDGMKNSEKAALVILKNYYLCNKEVIRVSDGL